MSVNHSCSCSTVPHKEEQYKYEDIVKLADFFKQKISIKPKIGIICGTGLGAITDLLTNTQIFDYKEIPGFPVSTVIGHAGRLLFGDLGHVPVMCMQGRFHFFEGYPLWKCVLPIRVMKLLGVKKLVLSNAAGSINPFFNVGDIMIIKDHINFVGMGGSSPLTGPNLDEFGPRFVAINDAYNKKIIKHVKGLAQDLGLKGVQEGVYLCLGGPAFETVAELRVLKMMGADAVGMSTVHEVVAARHCGIECFAISLITNKCIMEYETDEKPDHLKILNVGKQREQEIKVFIEKVVQYLGKDE